MNRVIPELGKPILPPGHIKTVWEHLNNGAADLKKSLTADEELAANVYLFGGQQIQVETFSCAGPNLLIVIGTINGDKIKAYIHQNALQVVFSVVPKDTALERQPLGFVQS